MKRLTESENFIARWRNHYSEFKWYAYRVLQIKLSKNPLFAVRLDNALSILENAALSTDDEMIQRLQKNNFLMLAMLPGEFETESKYLIRIREGEYLKKLTAIQHYLFEIGVWLQKQPPV